MGSLEIRANLEAAAERWFVDTRHSLQPVIFIAYLAAMPRRIFGLSAGSRRALLKDAVALRWFNFNKATVGGGPEGSHASSPSSGAAPSLAPRARSARRAAALGQPRRAREPLRPVAAETASSGRRRSYWRETGVVKYHHRPPLFSTSVGGRGGLAPSASAAARPRSSSPPKEPAHVYQTAARRTAPRRPRTRAAATRTRPRAAAAAGTSRRRRSSPSLLKSPRAASSAAARRRRWAACASLFDARETVAARCRETRRTTPRRSNRPRSAACRCASCLFGAGAPPTHAMDCDSNLRTTTRRRKKQRFHHHPTSSHPDHRRRHHRSRPPRRPARLFWRVVPLDFRPDVIRG